MPSRAERLNELLKKEISAIIMQLNDHRIGFVSITEVQSSEDLSSALVFVSFFGADEDKKKKSLRGLISAIPHIRHILSQTVELRIVPHLKFIRDTSIEDGDKRLLLINKLAEERAKREGTQKPD